MRSQGVWIVGLMSILSGVLGCSSAERRGSGVERFRVSQSDGVLIVACHQLNQAVITETVHELTQCEVKQSQPDGRFTLSPPARRGKTRVTDVAISKPGFQLYQAHYSSEDPRLESEPADGEKQIELVPATSYAQEAVAARAFEIAVHPLELDAEQRRMVDQHIAARNAYLEKQYPDQLAAAERQLARRSFRARPALGRVMLAAAALPDGGLAALVTRDGGRDLLILDAAHKVLHTVALGDPDCPAFTRDGDELLVVDDAVIRRFDFAGKAAPPITLERDPTILARAKSVSHGPSGYLVGYARGYDREYNEVPASLSLYSPAGKQLKQRTLPLLSELSRALVAPGGAVLVAGELVSPSDQLLGGMKWKDPKLALLRFTDWSAEPELLLSGFDSVVVRGDRLVVFAEELYRPEDTELVDYGFAYCLHNLLLELSFDGKVSSQRDLSDGAVTSLALGQPLGDRLVFFRGDQLYDLDPATGPSAPAP